MKKIAHSSSSFFKRTSSGNSTDISNSARIQPELSNDNGIKEGEDTKKKTITIKEGETSSSLEMAAKQLQSIKIVPAK